VPRQPVSTGFPGARLQAQRITDIETAAGGGDWRSSA
jgi:hypothetical protein